MRKYSDEQNLSMNAEWAKSELLRVSAKPDRDSRGFGLMMQSNSIHMNSTFNLSISFNSVN